MYEVVTSLLLKIPVSSENTYSNFAACNSNPPPIPAPTPHPPPFTPIPRLLVFQNVSTHLGYSNPHFYFAFRSNDTGYEIYDKMLAFTGKEFSRLYFWYMLTSITLPALCISESCIEIKIDLVFYFHTSLWCLRRFCEGLLMQH